jgi:Raf kinase inhibitor-like YbhB/YbcL family protein
MMKYSSGCRLFYTVIVCTVLILSAALACSNGTPTQPPDTPPQPPASPAEDSPPVSEPESAAFAITSTAFGEGEAIPVQYTCEGEDTSPPLSWSGAPAATKAYVLIVDDPDAPIGTWTHWVVINIPADVQELAASTTADSLPTGALAGKNSGKSEGYHGPCPPPGPAHRYRFTLYALDAPLPITKAVSRKDVDSAMSDHILAQSTLTGTFGR